MKVSAHREIKGFQQGRKLIFRQVIDPSLRPCPRGGLTVHCDNGATIELLGCSYSSGAESEHSPLERHSDNFWRALSRIINGISEQFSHDKKVGDPAAVAEGTPFYSLMHKTMPLVKADSP